MKFPVLLLLKNSHPFAYADENSLSITNMLAVKKKVFLGANIIDSTGASFQITSVKILRGHGAFGGYNIFFNREVEVHLTTKQLDKFFTLDDLIHLITSNQDFFDNIIGGEDVLLELQNCDSVLSFINKYYGFQTASFKV